MDRAHEIDVDAAARRLRGIAHRTPIVTSRTLDERTGGTVFLKAENFQRVGAFKFRGAYNRVSTLGAAALAGGVVTSSSGNHAQAVALAAALCGARATILMPEDAPLSKRAATTAYGAKVVSYDRYRADREALTEELAAQLGATLVHAYDDPYIVSGAGTTAVELLEDAGELDVLVVPTGGGGLLSGCSVAAKARHPDVHIVAVEPAASDDWQHSLAAGRRVEIAVERTIADGQQLSTPGALPFAVAQGLVGDAVTVSDAEIVDAMRFAFERLKVVLEPSGASALAAVLAGKVCVRGLRAGVILSGGNIDVARFREIVNGR